MSFDLHVEVVGYASGVGIAQKIVADRAYGRLTGGDLSASPEIEPRVIIAQNEAVATLGLDHDISASVRVLADFSYRSIHG
jgi:hypothetical protein